MPIERILNRVPRYDYRNLNLSQFITDELRQKALKITSMTWNLPTIDDQGSNPSCVGHAMNHFGNCAPILDGWPNEHGEVIYKKAKEIDGDNQDGTSTLSGVKAFMQTGGHLENNKYAFASSIEDIKVWLLTMGPVSTGTDWYSDMMDTDSQGVVHPTGYIAGGHEYLIVGYDKTLDLFTFANSWGRGWGINGFFYMSATDYTELMRDHGQGSGDAVTMVEVAAPTPEPPPPTPTPEPDGCLAAILGLDRNKLTRLMKHFHVK